MKGISLTQPYAQLVALGQKKIETRSWHTNYRGLLAIHAARGLGPVGGMTGLKALCADNPFYSVLLYAVHQGILEAPAVETMPRGAIVAVCELVGCLPINMYCLGDSSQGDTILPLPPEPELSFGDYSPRRWAWLLTNIRAVPEPVPCKGAQRLWTLDAQTLAAVEGQL